MNMRKCVTACIALLMVLQCISITEADGFIASRDGIIIDHHSMDIDSIPSSYIERAKSELAIAYGHTSHGSQLVYGLEGMESFKGNLYAVNDHGDYGALQLRDCPFADARDLGSPNLTTWASATRTYLDDNPEVNVVIWSWCGQVSRASEQDINKYLSLMNGLEKDYSNVKFVYMTGHLDGTGLTGNLHIRNEQIRAYCQNYDKILYDFADIESYDPDGFCYLDKNANDNCDYDSDGNGSLDANWATEWQASHQKGVEWYDCYAAHSQPVNANMKAYGAWYLFARLSGWDGTETQATDTTTDTSQDDSTDTTTDSSEDPSDAATTNDSTQDTSTVEVACETGWIKPVAVVDGCHTQFGDNLFDDDENSIWQHFSEEHHYIVLDLGATMELSAIRQWHRSTFDTIYGIDEIHVSDWPDSFAESVGSTERIHAVEPGWKAFDISPATGRYVKIVTELCRTPYFREIEFYSTGRCTNADYDQGTTDLIEEVSDATEVPADEQVSDGNEESANDSDNGTSTLQWVRPVSVVDGCNTRYGRNMFDSDESTIWQHFVDEQHYITLDMGCEVTLDAIRQWQRNTYDTVYGIDAIYISNDDSEFGDSLGSTRRIYAEEPGWKTFDLNNGTGRYIKIVTEYCRSPYFRELELGIIESDCSQPDTDEGTDDDASSETAAEPVIEELTESEEENSEEPVVNGHEITASSLTLADIQEAVDMAESAGGGSVILPAGTVTHDGILRMSDGVSLLGAGIGQTVIQNADIRVIPKFYGDLDQPFRLTGMTLFGNSHISVDGCSGFRIDHIEMTSNSGSAISVVDCHSSVIDHCTIKVNGSFYGVMVSGGYDDLFPNAWLDIKEIIGQSTAIFIEDTLFDGCHHSVVGHGNAHYVVRYCSFINNNSHPVDAHGPGYGPECGTRLVECYGNTFSQPEEDWKAIAIRGGAAIIWDNIINDYENGVILTLESRAQEFDTAMRPNDIWIYDNQMNISYDEVFVSSNMNNHVPILSEDEIILGENYHLREPSMDDDGFEYVPYAYPHPLTEGTL